MHVFTLAQAQDWGIAHPYRSVLEIIYIRFHKKKNSVQVYLNFHQMEYVKLKEQVRLMQK
ncbi:hypothetical protein GCM10020370_02530 [Paenibacillus hodogayensis]